MSPRLTDFLADLPGDPEERVDLLSRHEQELLASILEQAERLSAGQPELLRLMQIAIARAIGDLLLERAAEQAGIEIVAILKPKGPHPPKGEPLREPHLPKSPKPPGAGGAEPTTGPHPPKPPGPGKTTPTTGPHPPKPPGPGQIKPATGPHPPKPPRPPGPGAVKPTTGPHPPKPPGPGQIKPATGPHPPRPPGPGGTSRKASGAATETAGTLFAGAQTVTFLEELPAVHVIAEEFLVPSELAELMRYTRAHEGDFELSEVISPGVQGRGTIDAEYRRSRVLMNLAEHEETLLERIRAILPGVFEKLRMTPFTPQRSEIQITASNDGDFFHDHSDNSHPEIASRALTFVYFFHSEPKPFRGGELRLYDSRRVGEVWVRQGPGRVIRPEQNQMVFFPSDLVHEITPVICPSQRFEDSRFTVNGWLHRA
jgi:predicted 2-oxoglutarate/Fe(II)-dependent dioxygenase YbiX